MNFVLGGQNSPVNNVRGDILWGDSFHYDNGTTRLSQRRARGPIRR